MIFILSKVLYIKLALFSFPINSKILSNNDRVKKTHKKLNLDYKNMHNAMINLGKRIQYFIGTMPNQPKWLIGCHVKVGCLVGIY